MMTGVVLLCGALALQIAILNPGFFTRGTLQLFAFAMPITATLCGVSVLLIAIGGVMTLAYDDFRILDTEAEKVLLHRRIVFDRGITEEASFDEVAAIVIQWRDEPRKEGRVRAWRVYLELADDRAIPIGDAEERPLGKAPEAPVVPLQVETVARRLCDIMRVDQRVEDERWTPGSVLLG